MKIRNRLSIYFAVASAVTMLLVLAAVYFLYKNNARQDFFKTLHERALITANLYLEADEITATALQKIKDSSLIKLPEEVVRMYDSTDSPAFIKDPDGYWPKTEINKVRNGQDISYTDKDRQVVGIYYKDNQGNFVILVSAVDEVSREREKELLRIMIGLFVVQILFLYILGWFFAQRTLSPIKKINQQVQKITATDLHFRVDEGNNADEIGELAANFNQLLQRLQSSFEIQKTFIANASHELRTPLTSIVGELEVILAQQRTPEEYQKVMQSVLAEADKLSYIIQRLLELANAENKIALQEEENVRLDELLWELQQQFAKSPDQKLEVSMPILPGNEKELEIKANKQLLLLAIANIIRNGFKFSHNQPVQAILTTDAKNVTINIIDKGIGINKEDGKKIFEPFYRSSNAFSFNGHGLGLFIAHKIISLYGGVISVDSVPGQSTSFNICFTINTLF